MEFWGWNRSNLDIESNWVLEFCPEVEVFDVLEHLAVSSGNRSLDDWWGF